MKHTRNDVARLAGVSSATVSYVFSGKRYVSEDLRQKVLGAAKQLDYTPDMIAMSMITKKTNTVAILTSDIANPLFMELVKGFQHAAMEAGYFVNICGGTEHLDRYVENFIQRRIDGVFLSVPAEKVGDECLQRLIEKNVAVVITTMRNVPNPAISGIEVDMIRGMDLIVSHLAELGHRQIAYLSSFAVDYPDDKRVKGFRQAMRSRLGIADPLIVEAGNLDSDLDTGALLAERLLSSGAPFTAVVATNDLMAMGAISAFAARGVAVPDDVSVVGIDDIPYDRAFLPPLTSLGHRSYESGAKTFEVLRDKMERGVCRLEVFRPELVVRQSTRAVGR